MLAVHPFATDRPGTTHVMAVEFARALDAYESATREAVRDPALARRELDEGLAALNRLNARLVGSPSTEAAQQPEDRSAWEGTVKPRAPQGGQDRGERRAQRPPDGAAIAGPHHASTRSGAALPSGRAKPRLRDRHAPERLLLWAGLTAVAAYCVLVGLLIAWPVALVCLLAANIGVGLAGGGLVFSLVPIIQTRGALKGGRVGAVYRGTEKSLSLRSPWEQRYVHRCADGREVTYRRGVPSESLAPLPTRRLWLVAGPKPELITSTTLFLTPLSLILGLPLFLAGSALTMAAVPGVLVGALTGHHWW